MKTLKIATRKSPLALWQAEHVRGLLMQAHSGLKVELISMQTEGDRFLDAPLVEVGGKGLFIKELEQALLEGVADIAVHSMKDVTIELPRDFSLPVILQREIPNDVFISNKYKSINDMSVGCIVGTSSLRRQSQLSALHKDINIKSLRGNVGTRLRKLDDGEFDAIVLAAAGIIRLGLNERITQIIPSSEILPAIGQGAVGIECRANDDQIHELIKPLNDNATTLCVETERAFSRRLYGGCQLPIAGYAELIDNEISLTGLVARVDGSEVIKHEIRGDVEDRENIGTTLAEKILEKGADKILKEIIH